jgi:hypothetical protein
MNDKLPTKKFCLGDIFIFSSLFRKMNNLAWQYEVTCQFVYTGGIIFRDYRVTLVGKTRSDVDDAYNKIEKMMSNSLDVIK